MIFSFESSKDTLGKIFRKFGKDQTWFSWDIADLNNNYCFFFCLFACLFFVSFSFQSSQYTLRKIFWTFCKDQTWFSWDIIDLTTCLLVCLFDCLSVFYLKRLGIPPGRFPESFVKIWLDLAEILSIWKLFICFLFPFFVFFIWIISGYAQEDFLKVI